MQFGLQGLAGSGEGFLIGGVLALQVGAGRVLGLELGLVLGKQLLLFGPVALELGLELGQLGDGVALGRPLGI